MDEFLLHSSDEAAHTYVREAIPPPEPECFRPGDRVAACLPNDLDVVVAFHGPQRIGAIWTGINEAFAPDEQQALADLATPSLLLHQRHHRGPEGSCTASGT